MTRFMTFKDTASETDSQIKKKVGGAGRPAAVLTFQDSVRHVAQAALYNCDEPSVRDRPELDKMKARIRELLHTVPFQPFIIRTADGQKYRIEHPDFVLAAASDIPQITIEEADGRQHYLSSLLVTSVERTALSA
jgi:hypothetical protein